LTDTVVIKSDPTSGSPEGHDQAMIDLVDKSAQIPTENELPATDDTGSEDRPKWLPEKFKSAEDMAKAYAELESKIGKPAEPKADPETPAPAEATPDDANKALSERGLDMGKFSTEFAEKGELTPESYAELEKAGLTKDIVDQYIEGQKARATQYESSVKAEVGGDEQYNQMVTWAKANMSPAEITAFNNAVGSGDVNQAKLAVLGLSTRYSSANGSDPKRTIGGGKAGAQDTFESTAQLTEAMRDPRYKSDPAYRAAVQNKLSRSTVF
jgi:hypothetical protein